MIILEILGKKSFFRILVLFFRFCARESWEFSVGKKTLAIKL
jgi:hypothetical protein